MRIVCQQTILMKYHTLFVIFEKSGKIWNCRLMQIIGGALRVNFGILTCDIDNEPFQITAKYRKEFYYTCIMLEQKV